MKSESTDQFGYPSIKRIRPKAKEMTMTNIYQNISPRRNSSYTVSPLLSPTAFVYSYRCGESNLGEKGFILANNSRWQIIAERKAQAPQSRDGLSHHIRSPEQRSKEGTTATRLIFFPFIYSLGPQTREEYHSQQAGLPISMNVIKTIPTASP